MHQDQNIIQAEIPIIEKIIRDETWYEGERRGCAVSPNDGAVTKRVCQIIQKQAATILAEAQKNVDTTSTSSK